MTRLLPLLVLALLLPACAPITLSATLGGDPKKLNEATILQDPGAGSAKVAVIDVRGMIADRNVGGGMFSPGQNPVDELTARLDRAARDSDVKAVILRINSPGGTVAASESMHREVRRFSERTGKPVVASLGEVAASGGYYLALAADEILAQPTTITGSIGVIMPTMNFSEGLSRIGIKSRAIKSGPNKDLGNPFEPVREGQYAVLQGIVDDFYGRFKGLVVERRPLSDGVVDEATDGRVYTGTAAAAIGLVDAVGDIHDAFEAAKVRAGLSAAQMVKYHGGNGKPRSVYASAETPTPSANGAGPGGGTEFNLLQIELPTDVLASGASASSGFYYLWMPGVW